jgi:hypothetical protein
MQEALLDYSKVKQNYTDLSRGIQRAIYASKGAKEEKLKILTIVEFNKFFSKFGIDLATRAGYEETSVAGARLKGREDMLSGSLVMEFKTYDLLDTPSEYKKACEQVIEKYLNPIDKSIAPYFNAVVFDGINTVFIRYDVGQGQWLASKKKLNDFVLHDWILLITKTLKKPISSKELAKSFAMNTELASGTISTFYQKITDAVSSNVRVKMLFEEWKKSFSYIYGGILNEAKIKEDFEDIAKLIALQSKTTSIEVDKFLFCFYTYYAFIVKLYASEIASIYLPIDPDSPINALIRADNLKDSLRYLENGNFYKDYADIDNYIEGGFFSWYLDAWDSDIEKSVLAILHELNQFDFEITVKDEINSRDIIKTLYQDIIPQKIRHDLGEYYTPNWIIASIMNDVHFNGNLEERLLDPGCGSGGFLVEAINRVKKKNRNKPCEELLQKIIVNIVGFDVNPVAVLTARTNYLLAISSILQGKRTPIHITLPVYLADSIITPTNEGQNKLTNSYQISTVEGVFSLPKNFVDSGYLAEGMKIIEDCIESDYPVSDFVYLLKQNIDVTAEDLAGITAFYQEIKHLHRQGKNRMWVKIIQNSFAPLLHTEFDYVVGNPPWIKWEFLSREYKRKLGYLYLKIYKLFSHKGMKAGLGFAHDDISVVFMYVAIDKYLRKGGVLGFVMKQTLYKSVAGKEFRKFAIEKGTKSIPLRVVKVNDMLELRPFSGSAQAETSTLILEKGKETNYPVPYFVWSTKGELPKAYQSLSDIKNQLDIVEKSAYPHNRKNKLDIWVVDGERGKEETFQQSKNYYKPRHGIVNDLNACFFMDILGEQQGKLLVQNRVNRAKKKLSLVETRIEKDLVYPFLKPKNIRKWKTKGYLYAILPQRKNGEDNESELRRKCPDTYKYLRRFEAQLLKRSSRWFKIKGAPFYSVFGLGDYSFKPYKVVWCCMSYLPSFAVVSRVNDKWLGRKLVMPDNTIGYFPCDTENEAHYICAIMNSAIVQKYFESRSSKSKWGIAINMAESIPIPKFDKTNYKHLRLASLAREAQYHESPEERRALEKSINELSKMIL